MKPRFEAVLAALAVVALGAAVLVPVAGANGMMGGGSPASPRPTMTGSPASTPSPGPTSSDLAGAGWCGGGMWGGSGSWGGTGMWGTGSGASWLTDDPEALRAWLQLRAAHVAAMQTWLDTYKADLASTQAQQALHDLWTGGWNDMKAFYEQYGDGATWTCPALGMWGGWQRGGMMGGSWDPSHMWGAAYGASWMSRHPGAFGQWMTMRARQTATVAAWQQRHAGDLTGSKARAAMRTMQARLRTQVKGFYRNHQLTATTARIRYGAGGWMGLGGMWGGWGW
jgi:hypothetical protein